MLGYILAFGMPLLFLPIVQANRHRTHARMLAVLFFAYFLRIFLQFFLREVPMFSYGAGGDWRSYEETALVVRQFWEHGIYKYITADDYPFMGPTSLPPNLFGLIYFLNGGPTRIGCCSFVALTACLTCLNMYYLALELGVDAEKAFQVFCVMLLSPAFLLYTSDLYKDGLVLFFVVGSFASAIRLTMSFKLSHLALGIASCIALYGCRYYLIFVTIAPLAIGAVGVSSTKPARPLIMSLIMVVGLICVLTYTTALRDANETASGAWEAGTLGARSITYDGQLEANSNVAFADAGNPTGALPLKLLYTLLAPFPWMGGSMALQIGKLEAMIWYYMLYRASLAGKRLWRENRGILLMFLSFLVPTTFMYALIMVNVGLILRERMGLVYIGYLLAMLSWTPGAAGAKVTPVTDRPREASSRVKRPFIAMRRGAGAKVT